MAEFFDCVALEVSLQELRSATGEKMREVMYFYMKNPEAKSQENGKVPQLQQSIYIYIGMKFVTERRLMEKKTCKQTAWKSTK